MERHGIGARLGEIVLELAQPPLERVRFRRKRAVDGRLGERVVRLRHPDEVRGLLRGTRDHQGLRIGEANVLPGEDDDAPGDEHRVLAGVDHAHEPVERRVGVGAADALDERRDRVVVLIAGAVVQERPSLHRIADLLQADRALAVGARHRRVRGELERVQRYARVAVAHRDKAVLGLLRERHGAAQSALVGQGATHDHADLVFSERLQREHPRTRQQS